MDAILDLARTAMGQLGSMTKTTCKRGLWKACDWRWIWLGVLSSEVEGDGVAEGGVGSGEGGGTLSDGYVGYDGAAGGAGRGKQWGYGIKTVVVFVFLVGHNDGQCAMGDGINWGKWNKKR